MRVAVFVLLAVSALPTLASQPGSRWTAVIGCFWSRGLSCTVASPYAPATNRATRKGGSSRRVDNQGGVLLVERTILAPSQCGPPNSVDLYRTQLVRILAGDDQVLAYMDDRCGMTGQSDHVRPHPEGGNPWVASDGSLIFDPHNGVLYIPLHAVCEPSGQPCSDAGYHDGFWLARIAGFATTFDILQTYEPSPNELSFRVPYMPEGFPAADWFDTYYGPLTSPIDFSQAQPLQCEYPVGTPEVGEYLTVADTVPDPEPGQGYWYVTAVNYQGQRRYGRRNAGEVLSGRDPTVLPLCDSSH